MELERVHLTTLFNALQETGTTTLTVSHPGDAVGDICTFHLDDPAESSVELHHDRESYANAVTDVARDYGDVAADELPEPQSLINGFLAGGMLEPANREEIETFLQRNGYPDLTAGHEPVFAGFDTNLLAWRIADVLDLEPGHDTAINGYALATGVLSELDWDYKQSNTDALEEAFGASFVELWNQPAGSNREGRLGENYYRSLRENRHSEEISSDEGDESIVDTYDELQSDTRKDVLLFSNDRDFVEHARAHRVLAQRVEFPEELPDELTASWREIEDTLYVLTVLFGVLNIPKTTLYGVWKGKGGMAWQRERLKVECRSPPVRSVLERDRAILETYEAIEGQ
jgi:hypothetical protein